jgi:F0F1-type ATP synthase gamma subunit
MATIREIKEKQTSIKSINKITKAMHLVASAKAKKSIDDLTKYKTYANNVNNFVYEISKGIKINKNFNGTY